MELIQLRYFQKVARSGSLTRAAQELFISQPTLSQSLRRLETSVGCPLFEHKPGKSLQLNDAGILFIEKVDKAIAELEEGVNLAREANMHSSAQITLASSVHDLCSDVVLSYFQLHPEACISQRLVEINSLNSLLLNDEIDFAISPCPLSDTEPRIESVPLYTEENLAIVGPTHRLYGRKEVSRSELLGERFICNYSEADRNYLDMLFEQENSNVDVMLESNEPATIRNLVAQGAGIAFMPARIVMRRMETGDPAMQYPIRVSDYHHDTPTCISKKKSRCLLTATAAFYQFIIEYCKKEDDLVHNFIRVQFS